MRGDVHAFAQVKAMGFEPLNARIKIEDRAPRFHGDSDEIRHQRVAVTLRTSSGVGHQVVNGQLPCRQRGVDNSPSRHRHAAGALKRSGEAKPLALSCLINLSECVLVEVRSQLDKHSQKLTESSVVEADLGNFHRVTLRQPGRPLARGCGVRSLGFARRLATFGAPPMRTPMSELKGLVDNWILLAQGLIGSIGALALAIAELLCIHRRV